MNATGAGLPAVRPPHPQPTDPLLIEEQEMDPRTETAEIIVTRTVLHGHPGGRAARPIGWFYECTGPDGRQLNNRSVTELKRVLKRRYGNSVQVVEPWKKSSCH